MKEKTKKRVISYLLAGVMLLCQMECFAVWDGSEADRPKKETDPGTMTLVDMSSMNIIRESNASPSSQIKGSGNYTAHWNNHKSVTSLRFENIPSDWSDVEWIEMPIYSEKITNVTIGMVVRCTTGTGTGSPYYSYQIKIDWQGWKTFKLYLGKHMTQLNGADLSGVQYVLFSAKDYGGQAHEETDLYFDTITGHLIDYEKPARDAKALSDAMVGGVAVYNHSKNVLAENTVKMMDEDNVNAGTTTLNGYTMLPLALFEKHLGATVSNEGDKTKITLGDKYITLKADDAAFTSSDGNGSFVQAPFNWNGLLYVPIAETVKALGKVSKQYGGLNIIGSENNIAAFDANEELPSICINKFVNVVIGLDSIGESDFKELQKRLRYSLVGDETVDITSPYTQKIIEKVDYQAKSAWETMNYGEDRNKYFALFGTEPVKITEDMSTQATKLLYLAKGWGTYGSVYYKNEKLLADLLDGVEWFYQNLYGDDEARNEGWRDIMEYNWYNWAEDVPRSLINIYSILDDNLTVEQRRKYLAMTYTAQGIWTTGSAMDDSNSRLKRNLTMSIITEDIELLKDSIKDFGVVITPVESGNGYQEDGLFVYHGKFPYTSGYGINTSIAPVSYFQLLSGTKAAFENENKELFMDYMENTYYPILHKGRAQIMFGGRNITSVDDVYSGYQVIRASLYLIGVFGPDEDLWLKQMIRANVDDSNRDYILSMLSLDLIDKFVDIINDDSIPPLEGSDTDCRVYYTGDRVIQKRPDYTVGIAMSSQRIGNYESINIDNSRGWYTGDGALYVYNNGPKQFHLDYFKNVDWYKYPGTTEDTQERVAAQIALSQTWVAKNYIAGGVQFNNDYAAIAMDYQSLNNPSPEEYEDIGHGGAIPAHTNTLNAKKAWFLFDDEIVALGADINATDGFPVNTYINNRMLYENGAVPGMEDIIIDGELLPKSAAYTQTIDKVKWAHVESEGGYFFPQRGTLTVNKTDKNPSFLEMWFEHGASPKNKTYAYVVLPNKTAEETQDYTNNADIKILSNTDKIQAVKEQKLNLTGYIFWEAGEFDNIVTDNPLVIMTEETDTEYIVKISDAAQTLQSAVVKINRKLDFVEGVEIATVTSEGASSTITLDLREARGETHTIRFKKK